MKGQYPKAVGARQLSLPSPAKVNVFFNVLRKREDGFHEISSLYQAIDLQDTLRLSVSEKDSFFCSDPSLPVNETNLVTKALALFRKKTGSTTCFSIFLEKRIPICAGLGGGSSNAATALWAFAALTEMNVSRETFMSWGAELGSDVPFFFSSGSALASGRGEMLEDVSPLISAPFWVVKPGEGLSTPAVYAAHRCTQGKKTGLYNDLEEAAFFLSPSLEVLKKSLLEFGFDTVVLSGSGTAFFCLPSNTFPSFEEFKRKFSSLDVFFVKPLQRKHPAWYE